MEVANGKRGFCLSHSMTNMNELRSDISIPNTAVCVSKETMRYHVFVQDHTNLIIGLQ